MSFDKVWRTTSASWPSTSMSTPLRKNLFGISASSNARKPPFLAESAISTAVSISSCGCSILKKKALTTTFPVPKNWLNEKLAKVINNEPPNTIKNERASIKRLISPPRIMATTTKPMAPIIPMSVAISTQLSSPICVFAYAAVLILKQ